MVESDDPQADRSTLAKILKDVFVSSIQVISYSKQEGHVTFVILIKGKTKYLMSECKDAEVEYLIWKRFSELLNFNKHLANDMRNHIKKNKKDLPEFPSKQIFVLNSKSPGFIAKRISAINFYFDSLYNVFPDKIKYTFSLTDLCTPLKINIAVVGKKGCGKSSFIEGIIKLVKGAEAIEEEKRQQKQMAMKENKRRKQASKQRVESTGGLSDYISQASGDTQFLGVQSLKNPKLGGVNPHFSSSTGYSTVTAPIPKINLQQFFPVDVPHKGNYLFRLSMKEYNATEDELKTLTEHLVRNDRIDAVVFAFDITSNSSFESYLRKALKTFLMASDTQTEEGLGHRIPFIVLGLKKDLMTSQRVHKEEVSQLVRKMQEYIPCDLMYISREESNDYQIALQQVFDAVIKERGLNEKEFVPFQVNGVKQRGAIAQARPTVRSQDDEEKTDLFL